MRARPTPLLRAATAAAPWLAAAVAFTLLAERHWRSMLPFGSAGICGSVPVMHCAWCVAAVTALFAAVLVFALELRARPVLGAERVRP